jgi:hypothetical protein
MWKDGLRTGQGTMRYGNGDEYVGEWLDDERIGRGSYKWKDGSELHGMWSGNPMPGHSAVFLPANGAQTLVKCMHYNLFQDAVGRHVSVPAFQPCDPDDLSAVRP